MEGTLTANPVIITIWLIGWFEKRSVNSLLFFVLLSHVSKGFVK